MEWRDGSLDGSLPNLNHNVNCVVRFCDAAREEKPHMPKEGSLLLSRGKEGITPTVTQGYADSLAGDSASHIDSISGETNT